MLKFPLPLQAIEKNAEPIARDLATQVLKPAAAAADSADPASKQFTEEGVKPAAKIIADNVQPVAQGFTDETLLPTAQKVRLTVIGLMYTPGSLSTLREVQAPVLHCYAKLQCTMAAVSFSAKQACWSCMSRPPCSPRHHAMLSCAEVLCVQSRIVTLEAAVQAY